MQMITLTLRAVSTVIKLLSLTIEELGALGVALLHLFTFISCRLHVAVSHSEHCGPGLHQELAHLNVVAGCSTVKRCPVLEKRQQDNVWMSNDSSDLLVGSDRIIQYQSWQQ